MIKRMIDGGINLFVEGLVIEIKRLNGITAFVSMNFDVGGGRSWQDRSIQGSALLWFHRIIVLCE